MFKLWKISLLPALSSQLKDPYLKPAENSLRLKGVTIFNAVFHCSLFPVAEANSPVLAGESLPRNVSILQ